jgi:hypothetical protein
MLGTMRLIPTSILFVCLTVAGCHSWRVEPGPASGGAALATADSTKQVRLMLKSGAVVDLSAPHVSGDSVVGTSRLTGQRVAFAAADVQSVAFRHVSAGRTVLAAAGVAVVLYVILVGIAIASLGNSLN